MRTMKAVHGFDPERHFSSEKFKEVSTKKGVYPEEVSTKEVSN